MMGCMSDAAASNVTASNATGEAVDPADSGGPVVEDPAARAARLAAMAQRLTPFAELSELEPQHLQLVRPDERVAASDLVGAALLQAVNTMEVLGDIDPTELDADVLSQWTEGIETIRRMADGTVIDLGRRSRLFRGSARDAVMILATVCAWLGCNRPVHWCDADHSTGWKAHGATVPRNGIPLCRAHNLLKELGFHVHRDTHGNWHITDPDGNPIR